MTTKRTLTIATITEREAQLYFDSTDGQLEIYQAQDGGFFLTTRNADKRIRGVSITRHELIALAAALVRLAQAGGRPT